jgi:hypothetical protein
MKQLELELIDAAAHRMDANLQRDPQSPPLAVAPDEKEVEKHNLTHTHTIRSMVPIMRLLQSES